MFIPNEHSEEYKKEYESDDENAQIPVLEVPWRVPNCKLQ